MNVNETKSIVIILSFKNDEKSTDIFASRRQKFKSKIKLNNNSTYLKKMNKKKARKIIILIHTL